MKNITYLLFFIAVFIIRPNLANAQVIDSSFFNWTVYEMISDAYGNKKCYMINRPIEKNSSHRSRKEPYIIITRYQNERFEEIGIYMAWTQTRSQDSFIIQELLNRKNVIVRSNSSIGTFAVDKYSLKGIAKAYNRIKTICNS